jgi:hypothetical protein
MEEVVVILYSDQRLIVKAMLGMLPKQKSKAPSGPFEEAQW